MRTSPAALLPVLVASALLGGCSAPGGLDPAEARDRFTTVLDDTQNEVGGEWENVDDPTARNCTIPLFVDGTRYPALRLADAPRDASEAAAAVTEYWQGLDYRVDSTAVGDVTELQGSGRGEVLVFRVSDDGMTLQGESECRPD
ncbi:hypothetical protein CLV46_1362 [Diaminobutyricimonas aerilata]|uniref:LppA-like lipoprotein n=1 Tax=Diaminobutyricimonas aerilata TaxID=1162967 RepID=A0A2M9CIV5_9MICO|nr:hypothetical protein [Diaminobutyricimonas aerilata]PJJ71809.1 hypothetical protein CLV46_1362 [Diaminobutyricimonas aerilata]